MVGRNAVTFPFPYLDHVALHRGPEATAAPLETPDHLEHDKKDPRGKQRYDTPVKNGTHRVGRLGITRTLWPASLDRFPQSTGATMGGLLEAPER
jgi:hypothetical protein